MNDMYEAYQGPVVGMRAPRPLTTRRVVAAAITEPPAPTTTGVGEPEPVDVSREPVDARQHQAYDAAALEARKAISTYYNEWPRGHFNLVPGEN